MKKDKPLLCALRGHALAVPPVWLMRQAGRYLPEYRQVRASVPDFLSLCYHPEKASEVTLQPIRRYGMDGAILFSDILVIPDALGQQVKFVEKEGPRLEKITSIESVNALDTSRIRSHLAPITETISRVKPALPDHTTFIGFAGAPWTVACYMLQGKGGNFDEALRLAHEQPLLVQAVIDIVTESTITYLKMQIEAGVEALQLFDSWAGLVPDNLFDTLVIQPNARIASELKKSHPEIPLIGFAKSIGNRLSLYSKRVAVDALGIGMDMPMAEALTHRKPHQALQGNLDPILLATDIDMALKEAETICSAMQGIPFIFNLGHGMVPECPPEHVEKLVNFLRKT